MRHGGRALLVTLLFACGDEPVPMPRLLRAPADPPALSHEQCRPGAGDTTWVLEGEAASIEIGCRLGLALEGSAFVFPELPPGATWVPATRTLAWRPALDQAGLWHVPVHVPALAERGVVRIGVVENWRAKGNVRPLWPEAYPEEYGLPVVHLLTEEGFEKDERPAQLVHRGKAYDIAVEYRGNQSLKYPKKNFTLEFDEADPFVEPHFAGGFVAPKAVLTSNFDDASHVRQRLAFDLWNRLDPGHVPVRTFSVVLYLNGHYWGLYTMGDHVDRHLLAPNGIRKRANIYKAVRTSANFRVTENDGTPKAYLWRGIEKKEGRPIAGTPGAFADLEELIRLVDLGSDAEVRDRLPKELRLEEFQHWWALAVFGFTNDSVHKNVYFLHDPALGPWRCVPWDFNAAFGQDWKAGRIPATAVDEFRGPNELFARLLDEPSFDTRGKLAAALDGAFALADVLALVDGYAREIGPNADRDWALWGRQHVAFYGLTYAPTPAAELAYVRQWIADRWQVLHDRYATPAP